MVDSSGRNVNVIVFVLGVWAESQYESFRARLMFAPWFHRRNLNGPVPSGPAEAVPYDLPLALMYASLPTPPAGVHMRAGKVRSDCFIRTVTSHGPVLSTLFTLK